jgi:hypothetical protein
LKVPSNHWESVVARDIAEVCGHAKAIRQGHSEILLPFLNGRFLVDLERRSISRELKTGWERVRNPLFELVCLVYLSGAGLGRLRGEMVGAKQLKDAHFFTGPHALRKEPVLARYGRDLDGFTRAAGDLGGEALDLADAAFRFMAFPKIPLYYLLWQGDEEFEPRLSILFDRSIEEHLPADAVWGLVKLFTDILVRGTLSTGLEA